MIGDNTIGLGLIGEESSSPNTVGTIVLYATVPSGGTNVLLRTNVMGSVQTMIAASTGQATCTFGMGVTIHPAATSHGVGALTSNYLGAPAHISSTAAGAAHVVAYLSSPAHLTSAAAGVGSMANYLGSPFHVSMNAAGVAHWTSNYISSPVPLSTTTSNGVGGCTSNYLGSPLPVACTAHGAGHVIVYLSSRVDLGGWQIVHAIATMTAYQAGPIRVTAIANGVGHLEFASSNQTASSHGVSSNDATMDSHGGVMTWTANAGCYSYGPHPQTPALVFDLWGGHVAMALGTINGVATLTWGLPEFAFVCNAGCRAFGTGGSTPFFGVIILGPGGIFAQLRNNTNFTDHFPFGTSTPSGAGTMVAGFPNSSMTIHAGCLAYDTYTADRVLQPPFYPRGTGPNFHPSVDEPVPGGVFAVMFAPHTYIAMTATAGTTYDEQSIPNGVRIYLSSPIRYDLVSRGVAHFTIDGREASIFFNGVAGCTANYINVPSSNLESFESDGVGTAILVGPQAYAVTLVSAGIGHVEVYLASRVYLDTAAHGVAAFTQNVLFDYHWESDGGCYPYLIVTTLHPGIEFAMNQPARALVASSHGVASLIAELAGPRFLVVTVPGRGHMVTGLGHVLGPMVTTIHAGSLLHGVPPGTVGGFTTIDGLVAYGVIITVYQPHWADFNGVGRMTDNLNYTFIMHWQKRGDAPLTSPPVANTSPNLGTVAEGGVGGMILETRWFLSMTTKTNVDYLSLDGHYLYPPDAWHLVVAWALESRARGRTRMYFDFNQIAGNLLALFFAIPQPWQPNIDGDSSRSAMAGQFWPRQVKLPFRNVEPATHPYIWRDYEYWRR